MFKKLMALFDKKKSKKMAYAASTNNIPHEEIVGLCYFICKDDEFDTMLDLVNREKDEYFYLFKQSNQREAGEHMINTINRMPYAKNIGINIASVGMPYSIQLSIYRYFCSCLYKFKFKGFTLSYEDAISVHLNKQL